MFDGDIGSSPRVRGTGPRRCRRRWCLRFIPAGAGNSHRRTAVPVPCPVHPRGCGEQHQYHEGNGMRYGSSPRVRGTAGRCMASSPVRRFIPAGAGNRPARSGRPASRPVHPRGCGEQSSISTPNVSACGSSPRVRGTACVLVVDADQERFIPAGAGNSPADSGFAARHAVHPRGCGEQCRVGCNDR